MRFLLFVGDVIYVVSFCNGKLPGAVPRDSFRDGVPAVIDKDISAVDSAVVTLGD